MESRYLHKKKIIRYAQIFTLIGGIILIIVGIIFLALGVYNESEGNAGTLFSAYYKASEYILCITFIALFLSEMILYFLSFTVKHDDEEKKDDFRIIASKPSEEKICSFCGAHNKVNARRCSMCGKRLKKLNVKD